MESLHARFERHISELVWLRRTVEFLFALQSIVRSDAMDLINNYADSHANWLLTALSPVGLIFGAAHALTPGHSKMVLATYVVGSDHSLLKTLTTSLVTSFIHVASGVAFGILIGSVLLQVVSSIEQASLLKDASRIAIVVIGLGMTVRPYLHGKYHLFEPHCLATAAGLVPCPLTLAVTLLAIERGVPIFGLMFAVSIFLGVTLILGSTAFVAFMSRAATMKILTERAINVTRIVEMVCGLALAAIALTMR